MWENPSLTTASSPHLQLNAVHPKRTDVLLLLGAAYYQLGDFANCIAANDAAIMISPNLPEAHANLANALLRQGSVDLAVLYYSSALRLKPDFVDAYANLAAAYLQRGWISQAADAYASALAIDPGLTSVRCSLGDLWRAQGAAGRPHAMKCYMEVLQRDAKHSSAWRGMGECAREGGQLDLALKCYREAAVLAPESVETLTGLGMAFRELKHLEEAELAFSKAAKLRPECALTLGNLAGALYEGGKLEAAIRTYRAALSINPNFPEALNNLGNALREAGQPGEAVGCYTTCIQLQLAALAQGSQNGAMAAAGTHAHRLAISYNNLGGVLKLLGRIPECASAYEHVVLLQPAAPEAHANAASAYKDAGRHDEAIIAYTRALGMRPDFPEAFSNLVHSMQCVCDWRGRPDALARLERDVRRDLAANKLPSVQPFHAMTYPFPAELALTISRRYAAHCSTVARRLPGAVETLPHPEARPLLPGERLRVGYVSSDFGNHPLSHLMGSVFGLHDRSHIEVFCYALSPDDGSEWRKRIAYEAEHFLDVSSWTSPDIAHRLSDDGIHIAVNLNGYTKGARNEVFALKPAPVQCSYLGFPATMGADYIPYIVLDKNVCPPTSRHCYSENVAYLPNTYFTNDYKRSHSDVLDESTLPTRAEVGLPEDCVIYSCANQLYKYDPDTFGAWCNILHRVPNSVLWLLRFPPAGEPRIRAEAAARGLEPARIVFTDVAPKALHIARSGLADVFLDTPLCNAHTTGCDVLWGGAPMVTLPLERMASRVAASLCHATGLGDAMVVGSLQEYEDRAVELGLNHEKRCALRVALKEARLTCPLFDTDRWVRDFERVLTRMWSIHCEGTGPRDFEVGSSDA